MYFNSIKYESPTLSGLTGFILGSLLIIWPWKSKEFMMDDTGQFLMKKGEKIVSGYNWQLPGLEWSSLLAVGMACLGILLVWFVESMGSKESKS